jgi:hypothetical protein
MAGKEETLFGGGVTEEEDADLRIRRGGWGVGGESSQFKVEVGGRGN